MNEKLKSLEDVSRLMETFTQAFEKLRGSHAIMESRVAELQKELEEKNRLLDQKTRLELLGEVSATLAHEIRNPLGGIQLYADILKRELGEKSEQAEIVRKIARGVENLNQLVTDILTFAGEAQPRRWKVGVDRLVDAALENVELPKVKVVKRYGLGGVELELDGAMIQRALVNLVTNAADAMGGEGTVTIATGRDGARAFVDVVDAGPGIPADVLPKLFTPFHTTKARGVGLGLAIARKLVAAHGGTLTASNNDGPGATFRMTL